MMKKFMGMLVVAFFVVVLGDNVSACYEEKIDDGAYHEVVKVLEMNEGHIVVENVVTGDVFGYTSDIVPPNVDVGETFWAWSVYNNGELTNFHMEFMENQEEVENAKYWYGVNKGIFELF